MCSTACNIIDCKALLFVFLSLGSKQTVRGVRRLFASLGSLMALANEQTPYS
jgi:hypothetical protein